MADVNRSTGDNDRTARHNSRPGVFLTLREAKAIKQERPLTFLTFSRFLHFDLCMRGCPKAKFDHIDTSWH